MTEGLFDRYFRLLAGRLPAAEYGVIAELEDEGAIEVTATPDMRLECLC